MSSSPPGGWREMTLQEVASNIRYGLTASATDDRSAGPRFVRITDILSGRVAWHNVPFCDAGPVDLDKYGLEDGDIVIARIGASAGTAARVDRDSDAVFASYLVRVRIDAKVADNHFVGYVLQSPYWQSHVEGTRGGSAQPQFNAPLMKIFRFWLPPLDEQRSIVSVLNALDAKIESNRRLRQVLDGVGRELYGRAASDLHQ